MKEIRFRGKQIDNGEWVYGYYSLCCYGTFPCEPSIIVVTDGEWTHEKVDPATVGQYTGLKDKNGVEICEGDIVVQDCYLWFCDGKPNYRGTVEWIYSQWQVVAHCANPDVRGISDGMNEGLNDIGWDEGENSSWEIIGNIHDNPTLLTNESEEK